MRASDLPSPGALSNGQTLRHEAAHAISRAQINRDLYYESTTGPILAGFFMACAFAANGGPVTEEDTVEIRVTADRMLQWKPAGSLVWIDLIQIPPEAPLWESVNW